MFSPHGHKVNLLVGILLPVVVHGLKVEGLAHHPVAQHGLGVLDVVGATCVQPDKERLPLLAALQKGGEDAVRVPPVLGQELKLPPEQPAVLREEPVWDPVGGLGQRARGKHVHGLAGPEAGS